MIKISMHKREYSRTQRNKLKLEVFTHYSAGTPKCFKCGITDLRVLTLDHPNSDGNKSRTKVLGSQNRAGWPYYSWLRAHNYPEKLDVLCFNCHHILEYERREMNMKALDLISLGIYG